MTRNAKIIDKRKKELVVKVPKVLSTITSVEFLNGDDTTILTADGEQFVNLPRADKWVDGTIIKNKDRLSNKPRILVKFDKPGNHEFWLKFELGADNSVYTAAEEGRNTKFKYQKLEKKYTTGNDGSKIVEDFFLTMAGEDEYTLVAKDKTGKEVKSKVKIKTKRFFYYVELKMKGLTTVANSLSQLETEYKRNSMILKGLPSVEMDHMENIGVNDSNTFKNKARTAYDTSTGKDKQPYCMAISYTDHLAVKNANQRINKIGVDVGPGKPDVVLPIKGAGLTSPSIKDRALWKGLVTGEDWFVSCEYIKTGGTAADAVTIVKAKCTTVQKAGYPAGYHVSVKVSVSHLAAGTGKIKLKVNWVDRMRGGLAFGNNIVCVCTKAWWQTKNAGSQNRIIVHEIGHKVGMVSDGSGTLPDKVSTHYDSSKGHVGNHCYYGNPDGQARYDSGTDSANAKCVMYGATGPNIKFCVKCHPTMNKLDISTGWSKF